MNRIVKIFSDGKELANYTVKILDEKIKNKKDASKITVALSGGSTPKKIFNYFANDYKDKINWNNIKFFFGDERCVPPNNVESNFKMANENLFKPLKISTENIFRIRGEESPANEIKRYEEVLKKELLKKDNIPQFDIVFLGIGKDGHTASIFPNQIELFKSKNFCEVAIHPVSKQKRITITGSIINNAKAVVFIVLGTGKSKIIQELLNTNYLENNYPASLVNPANGKVIWLLDNDAAKYLKK